MASSNLVKELSRKPPAVKAAMLVGVMAVFGFLYYQFVYSGLQEDVQAAEVDKKRLITEKNDLTRKIEEKKALEKRYDELQKTIAANARALPSEAELPAFFDHLQKKAGEAGVSIRKWDRVKEQAMGQYFKVPVKMEVTGTFQQILKYFSLLSPRYHASAASEATGETDVAERLVTIEELSLGDPKPRNDEIILTAKFTASTFRQEGGVAVEAPKKEEPKKGAVDKGAQRLTNPGADVPAQ